MNGSMASACTTSSTLVSAPSACPSKKKTAAARFRRHTVSCRATGGGRGDNDGLLWLPRRDVMLNGLSGVAAGLAWYPGLADAECTRADKVNENTVQCTDTEGVLPCPLVSATAPVVDFTPEAKVTRVRQPVHLLSREYQEKYKEAVEKMKALPESNPLSFAAQAAIHQAYCDSYYSYHRSSSRSAAAAKDDPTFDVHFSWIFAPWHRMYIYFYERALGQLIGDDTFALPFWNWDAPAGMVVPPLFSEGSTASNPLYDANRNPANLDALIDLDYLNDRDAEPIPFKGPKDEKYKKLVNKNLSTVYNQQVRKGAESFLGEKYCTDLGSSTSSMGSLERMAHTAVHVWVGKAGPTPATATCSEASGGVQNHSKPGAYSCNNDMGFLGSAGRDPLFYSHHANVDRMWHLWSTRLGGGQGITDTDWLDASFVFYDGVKRPRKVRIKFRDVLDTRDLGYAYDVEADRDLPWLRPKITTLVPHGKDSGAPARSSAAAPVFPLALTKGQVVEVPAVAVPVREAGKEQLLVIDGVEFDPQANNKFDVAINVPADKALQVGPQYKEYAGSFAVVPGSGAGGTRKGKVSLCITDVLYDLDAEDDSTVDVVIVPRTAAKVTINVRPTIKNRN
ncbi:polyphenol oxidase I, chloroplastic-like [Miscanthus floridulus]|uniref:polyphenol oxidase I, chloroplastic-like n=1 Tax=Miscanthus floridulus TaxID=154761 RepID=UPI00345742B2